MRLIELLAPARDKETALAAIDHGADAVYIGAGRYGARAAACNSTQDISEVVQYAHQFGVKVYVTLNTLLHDDELDDCAGLAHEMFAIGVDAIISQDHRMVEVYRSRYPRQCGVFHASTQMDNRDAAIVRERQAQGYSQVVLARELTVGEIAQVHRQVPLMPLEVFVHGAVCVCYNGRCHASEVCYGRSADRGECAQFCRMRYTLETAGGKRVDDGYLLSMRDMNRTGELEELLDAGVTSLKIEGRLKDVAYVKNVTAWYRRQLDGIFRRRTEYRRSSWGRETFFFTPDVDRTFNRGYTDYFMHGRTSDLCNQVTPKSMGARVGFVKEIRRNHIVVAGTASFSNGDGLCFIHDGRLIGFRINRADDNHLYPYRMPPELRDGTVLYRNQDMAMEKILAGKTAERKIQVKFVLEASDGDAPEGFRLTAVTEWDRFGMDFEYQHWPAQKPQAQGIREVLCKTGDTIYQVTDVTATDSYFIPRSVMAEWRRKVLDTVRLPAGMTGTVQPVSRGAAGQDTAHGLACEMEHGKPLMTCRYCIRFHTGICPRENPDAVRGPLYLRGADGRRFLLRFDCGKCEMRVMGPVSDKVGRNEPEARRHGII